MRVVERGHCSGVGQSVVVDGQGFVAGRQRRRRLSSREHRDDSRIDLT